MTKDKLIKFLIDNEIPDNSLTNHSLDVIGNENRIF